MKDRKNAYTCDICGESVVTIDRDEGVTPFTLHCYATRDCDGTMRSQFYAQDEKTEGQPAYEWRKPTRAEYRRMSPAMREHVDKGGLDIYPLEAVEGPSEGIRDKQGRPVRVIYRSPRDLRPAPSNVNRSKENARRARQLERKSLKMRAA